MGKVFLSHSSKDKDRYIKFIAESLGKDRCTYDEFCFEIGDKTIEQIFDELEKTDIFVFFISENSLSSEWVKKELMDAEERISQRKIKQIYPIIIDENITYKHPGIPKCLKSFDNYNIRYIKNNKIALKKIKTQLLKNYFSDDINIKKELFYGRELEIKKFKDRFNDVEIDAPKCFVASGFEGMGRQSYINKCLRDVRIFDDYYKPNVISVEASDGIEDVILKICELGFANYTIKDIASIRIEERIELLSEIMRTIQEYQEFIIIYDNGCIINYMQELAWWFQSALKSIRPEMTVGIASKYKLNELKNRSHKSNDIFSIDILELSIKDRVGLLRDCAIVEGLELERNDIDF